MGGTAEALRHTVPVSSVGDDNLRVGFHLNFSIKGKNDLEAHKLHLKDNQITNKMKEKNAQLVATGRQ